MSDHSSYNYAHNSDDDNSPSGGRLCGSERSVGVDAPPRDDPVHRGEHGPVGDRDPVWRHAQWDDRALGQRDGEFDPRGQLARELDAHWTRQLSRRYLRRLVIA